VTGINQLWVADITYVRLQGELVYLAVILDGFSRKVVGWALDHTMISSRLTIVHTGWERLGTFDTNLA
jgi:putative transposase